MIRVVSDVLKFFSGSQSKPFESSVDLASTDEAPQDKKPCSATPSENSRTFIGKVTKICADSGMIDGFVYFATNCVVGGVQVREGDEVSVSASRGHLQAAWRADRVELVEKNDWHRNECKNEISANLRSVAEINDAVDMCVQSIVGTVTTLSRYGGGMINGDAAVFSRDVVVRGYIPCVGDWVKADIQFSDVENQWNATRVQPLRVRTFDGRIRSLFKSHGFINDDIYFSKKVCVSKFYPKVNDLVKVTAIECSYKQTNWRAIRVEPSGGRMADHRIGCRRPYSGMSVGGHDDSKYGVSVTGMLDAGEIFIGQTTSVRSLVRNESHENITMLLCKSVQDGCSVLVFTPCSLKEPTCEAAVVAAAGLSSFETEHSAKVTQFPVDLVPGHECIVEMTIFGSDVGYAEHKMEFIFAKFVITRTLSVTVCDPLEAAVTPSIPYKRSCHAYHYEDNSVSSLSDGLPWHVPGRRPIRTKPRSFPNKLPEYPVSARLRACVIDQENIVDVCPSIGRALTMDSYSQRFSSLLHIEEVQIEINMGEFDMAEAVLIKETKITKIDDKLLDLQNELERKNWQVTMEKQGSYFQLPVPGLAEGRPSLLVGDKVIATVPGKGHSEPSYEGYIHEVYGESILLQFSEDFHRNFQNEDYDILFTFNRTPLRRCLQAVEFAKNLSAKVLFPGKISPMSPIASVPMKGTGRKEKTRKCGFFNLSLNERQKEAVQHIVSGRGRPAPYILFGPPGTGKTVTLVEGILQVLHCIPSSRVIACTPSNSAADLIAERLHLSGVIGQGDMARLNAYQRQKDPPDCILPYCHTPDDLDLVSRYRVVVSTCVTAGTLYCLGLNVGHFTHVFVDEAGQATEPESLIAVNFAAGSDSQIILTGDPFQLGAVVQSAVAKTHGLDVSLLERLTNRLCYQRDERQYAISGNYNPLCVTKLINNYRSHPALLVLPSDTFYDGELVPFADRKITHFLCGWEHLPNKNNFPILFHGIRGKDVREGSSPSWFNPVEAVQVTKYVQALLSGSYGVQGHHIGVITPYRKQVEKIRLLLNRLGVDGIKVGSVEEFQGQERRVIILSTVRSSSSQVGFDVRHCLGFLSNPKRFNVAITRAQALLLVVGDPFVLTTDRLWWSFVRYCYDHNAYIGVDIGNLNLNNFEEDEICDGTVDGSAADKESDAN